MAGTIKELTDLNFQESVKAGVTLVDFWAPWCPPCRKQGPIVDKVAEAFDGVANITKMNVDENGAIAGQYNVANIPTLIIFKDGKEVKRMVGLHEEADLKAAINAAMS